MSKYSIATGLRNAPSVIPKQTLRPTDVSSWSN